MITFPRDTLLALTRISESTWDQRQYCSEVALAFGLSRPAHANEYTYPDACAVLLAHMIHCFIRLELKRAAEIVRETWDGDDGWLALLTKAERYPLPEHPEQFVCIAWRSLDRNLPPRVVMGDTAEIATALRGQTVAPTFISMHYLLKALRGNAKLAGVRLPPRLTIARGEPGFKDWRREIDSLREHAGLRARTRTPA